MYTIEIEESKNKSRDEFHSSFGIISHEIVQDLFRNCTLFVLILLLDNYWRGLRVRNMLKKEGKNFYAIAISCIIIRDQLEKLFFMNVSNGV